MEYATPAYYRLNDSIHNLILRTTLRQRHAGRPGGDDTSHSHHNEAITATKKRKSRRRKDSDDSQSSRSSSSSSEDYGKGEEEQVQSPAQALKAGIEGVSRVPNTWDSATTFSSDDAGNFLQIVDLKWQQKRFGPQEIIKYSKHVFTPSEETEELKKTATEKAYEEYFRKYSAEEVREELSKMPHVHIYSMVQPDTMNEELIHEKLSPLSKDSTRIQVISSKDLHEAKPLPSQLNTGVTVMYILASITVDPSGLLQGDVDNSLCHVPLAYLRAKPEEQMLEVVPGFSLPSPALGVLAQKVDAWTQTYNKNTSMVRESLAEEIWKALGYDKTEISGRKTETAGLDPVLVAFGDTLMRNCTSFTFQSPSGTAFDFMIQNAFSVAQVIELPHPASRAALEASEMSAMERRDRMALERVKNRIAWNFTPAPPIDDKVGMPSVRMTIFAEIVAAWDFDANPLFVHWELWNPPGGGWKKDDSQDNQGFTQVTSTIRRKWTWVSSKDSKHVTNIGPRTTDTQEEEAVDVAQYCYPLQFSLLWEPSRDDLAIHWDGNTRDMVPGTIHASSMPVLYLSVFSTDSWNHHSPVGYTYYTLPRQMGSYAPELKAWSPQTSIRQRMKHFFLGATTGTDSGNLVSDESISGIPKDMYAKSMATGTLNKYGMQGSTTGKVGLRLYSISQSTVPQITQSQSLKGTSHPFQSTAEILENLHKAEEMAAERSEEVRHRQHRIV